jgi:rfaE bifunctional protein nucleotidyltransferase chain/domain/rfaE bifunctional protein kinase chain/domain
VSRIVVVGDALLDRDVEGRTERECPEAPVPVVDEVAVRPRPGGAALAAALAAAEGHHCMLVAALAADRAGRELGDLIAGAGVEVADLGLEGATPEKVRIRANGTLVARVDRGGPGGPVGPLTAAARRALSGADAVLVSDYGRGVAAAPSVRAALADAPTVVWDPHPRGPDPVRGVRLVTPNRAEAAPDGDGIAAVFERARALRRSWAADGVAVTLGKDGAVLATADGGTHVVPAPALIDGDPCGAGDRFAVAAVCALAAGATLLEATQESVRAASGFVAGGGASALRFVPAAKSAAGAAPNGHGVEGVLARVRERGGTVVATGGCFDLLHAGHVATLNAARSLGDCLVVCLNSDASVRKLKGDDRPLVSEADRAAVLESLACVDAVVLFDEPTPEAVLQRIRPDVWAKGGDYEGAELPESAVLARWGGRVVILPYVEGRSTTRLLEEVVVRAR